jgi:hypothetical protein
MIGPQSQVLRNVDLRHGKTCPHAWMQKESVSHGRLTGVAGLARD